MTTRRSFLQTLSLTGAALATPPLFAAAAEPASRTVLEEFAYRDVALNPGWASTLAAEQFEQTQAVLMGLNVDSLLKPWRLRAGLPAPGPDLGGWYDEVPPDQQHNGHGFDPADTFGQWISALSRGYAVTGDPRVRAHIRQILDGYGPAISGRFYKGFRFPCYDYDKVVIGMIDAHRYANLPDAFPLLDRTTDAAQPHLPPHVLDRGEPQRRWRASIGDPTTDDYTWDEPYTLPEDLWIAAELGAGERYRQMAPRYLLDDHWYDPLSQNQNVLADHHAYSFCNSLSSAARTWLNTGNDKYLRAASNAFAMVRAQSFAPGGWGPNEAFVAPGSGQLHASLTSTHNSFETPCGSYAHFKITRYLLRITGDGSYGDSMERVFYNTVLGAKRLESDGHAFYYSDYNFAGHRVYHPDRWPCCSGTLPQVAADYHILGYFRSPDGIAVNLYLPSTLTTVTPDGAQLALTQSGEYPLRGNIALDLKLNRPSTFALRLRIPAWAVPTHENTAVRPPALRINGTPAAVTVRQGFAVLHRRWSDGDRVDLALDLPTRLEPVDPEHPDTVALLRGPLVLFAITEGEPRVTRDQLLAATRVPGQNAWSVQASSGELRLVPFTHLWDNPYTTYFNLS